MNMSEAEINQRQAERYRYQMAKQARKQARKQRWGAHLDTSRIILSVALIALGLICLLNNLGITSITFVYAFNLIWPALLLILGLLLIINFRSMLMMVGGLILMVAGALFLVNNSGLWQIDFAFAWGILWPLIVVFIGANLLFHEREVASSAAVPVIIPPAMPPVMPPAHPPTSESEAAPLESAHIQLDKEPPADEPFTAEPDNEVQPDH